MFISLSLSIDLAALTNAPCTCLFAASILLFNSLVFLLALESPVNQPAIELPRPTIPPAIAPTGPPIEAPPIAPEPIEDRTFNPL